MLLIISLFVATLLGVAIVLRVLEGPMGQPQVYHAASSAGFDVQKQRQAFEASAIVHLSDDGAVLVIPGDRSQAQWVSRRQFEVELERVAQLAGCVSISRDDPGLPANHAVSKWLAVIESFGCPIDFLAAPHPTAQDWRPASAPNAMVA